MLDGPKWRHIGITFEVGLGADVTDLIQALQSMPHRGAQVLLSVDGTDCVISSLEFDGERVRLS